MANEDLIRGGTASVENGSRTVTGIGVAWGNVLESDSFGAHVGLQVPIASVAGPILTLAYPWPGPSQTNAAYAIQPKGDPTRFGERVRQTLERLYEGSLAALTEVEAEENTFPYFTGEGAAAAGSLTPFARTLLDDANASTALATLGFSDYFKTLVDDPNGSTVLNSLGVSAFIRGLLDDVDGSTALSTLGVSTFIKTLLDDTSDTVARATLGVGSAGRQAYERGTWTPSVTFSGNAAGVTYSNRFGYYIRIGKMVVVFGEVNLSNKGVQGGGAAIAGLPWAAENGTQLAMIGGYNNFINTTYLAGQIQAGIIVVTVNTTTGIEQAAWDRFTNTSFMRFAAVYQGAATDV